MEKTCLILNKSNNFKEKNSKEISQLSKKRGGAALIEWLTKALKDSNYKRINISSEIKVKEFDKNIFKINQYSFNSKKSVSSFDLLKRGIKDLNLGGLIIDSGIILRERALRTIDMVDEGLVVGVEKVKNLDNINKTKLAIKNGIICLSEEKNSIPVYFSGVVRINKNISSRFVEEVNSLYDVKNLEDLIIYFLNKKIKVYAADISGDWAKIDRPMSLSKFIFGTKAETLERLNNILKSAEVLPQVKFTVKEWNDNKSSLKKRIKKEIKDKFLVIRSSSLKEDSFFSSNAGNFLSVLAVPNNFEEIEKNIKKVIKSYGKSDDKIDESDQILIQPFLKNIQISGVILTADQSTRSPYFIINYERNSGTEGVTSGKGKNLITEIISKNISKIKDKNLNKLLNLSNELSSLVGLDFLDIEFAIDSSGKLFLLQVRPLIINNKEIEFTNKIFFDYLKEAQNKFKAINKPAKNLSGKKTILGNMPDWNPAEIIGNRPKDLSYSLYKKLITDRVWAKARKHAGYKEVNATNLMYKLAGHPYIDIRASLNSFLPSNLDENLSKKLIDLFLKKIKDNPEFHDKIEFEVIPTCIDFNFKKHEEFFLKNKFTLEEINLYKKELKNITNKLISQKRINIREELEKLKTLEEFRKNQIENANEDFTSDIKELINKTINFGTLPFSKLARNGFIAIAFLNSMVEKNIITREELEKILNSIPTIATEITEKVELLKLKKISEENFLLDYGHLRPGTYDILSPNYKENINDYFLLNSKKKDKKAIKKNSKNLVNDIFKKREKKINELINKEGFNFSLQNLLDFILEAIPAREYAKFIFTKSIDQLFSLIVKWGLKINFYKEDLAFLPIDNIINSNKNLKIHEVNSLSKIINKNKKNHKISLGTILPDLIFSQKDLLVFSQKKQNPNFVTNKSVEGKIEKIKIKKGKKLLTNSIILIENADPGYDWIFTHNIKGLITKYGGAASHMAIRAGEFQIPAAIGCGASIFNQLSNARYLKLDCANRNIVIIS